MSVTTATDRPNSVPQVLCNPFKEEGFTPYGYVTWLYTWACYLQTVYLVQRSQVSPAHYVTAGKGVK